MSRPPRTRPGQATVEFALVVPLVVMCTVVVVIATITGLRVIALAGLARDATRAAAVADSPCEAAKIVVGKRATVQCTIDHLPSGRARSVHVLVTHRWGAPGMIGAWVSALAPRASATMLIEPPPVLG